jgi:prolyl oligopeptidase
MVFSSFPWARRLLPAILSVVAADALYGAEALTQPVAPVRPVTDTYFGTTLVDPYRWMEDIKSPELQAWVKAQAAYTKNYLAKLPGRDALLKRVEQLDNASTRVESLELCGPRYFYMKTTPADQTPKLYVRDRKTGKERLLADPQALGTPGKRYSISAYYASPDGKMVAVEVAPGGSEEGVLHILDAATGKPLKGTIDRVWDASVVWGPGDGYFYYSRLQKIGPGMTALDKELDEAAFLHHLGDDPEKDIPVLGRKFNPPVAMVPTDSAGIWVSPGSPYAIGYINHGVKNEITLVVSPADAVAAGKPVWTKVVDVDDDVVNATFMGHDLWLMTHKDAPKFKIVHVDLDHPDITKAGVVVPNSDLVLRDLVATKDGLYIEKMKGVIAQLSRIPYGQTTEIPVTLPFPGSIIDLSASVLNDGLLARLSAWTQPPQWYAYDPATDKMVDTGIEPRNPVDFSGITSAEVTATAPDGTQVPLSIIYKKGLKLDGQNPCLMEGYGAYGFSMDPRFDPTRLALLEKGIVVAWAHVRGGGENGEQWHLDGQKLTKQNTISDFIACAQYLIDHGYTSATKLALRGTSAGGITIGGALTQRPDLIALAIVNVGVVNALRAEAEPNGASNTPEFGSVKDPDGFKALYAMDAYQHVKDGTAYPAVLLITGANDPRVDPVQLFKMTARLQAATSSKNPVLLRVDTDAGHGIGSTKKQRDAITADQAALLLYLANRNPGAPGK